MKTSINLILIDSECKNLLSFNWLFFKLVCIMDIVNPPVARFRWEICAFILFQLCSALAQVNLHGHISCILLVTIDSSHWSKNNRILLMNFSIFVSFQVLLLEHSSWRLLLHLAFLYEKSTWEVLKSFFFFGHNCRVTHSSHNSSHTCSCLRMIHLNQVQCMNVAVS